MKLIYSYGARSSSCAFQAWTARSLQREWFSTASVARPHAASIGSKLPAKGSARADTLGKVLAVTGPRIHPVPPQLQVEASGPTYTKPSPSSPAAGRPPPAPAAPTPPLTAVGAPSAPAPPPRPPVVGDDTLTLHLPTSLQTASGVPPTPPPSKSSSLLPTGGILRLSHPLPLSPAVYGALSVPNPLTRPPLLLWTPPPSPSPVHPLGSPSSSKLDAGATPKGPPKSAGVSSL